jgi:hypothetical protein
MSMYGLVFNGQQAQERGRALLAALGFTAFTDVGRYRDSWVERGDDGEPVVAVYTRNGGGNRGCYAEFDMACDGHCTGCVATKVLPAHPLYLRDRDDDFDSTYATFYFRAPAEWRDQLEEIAQEPVNMSERWQQAIEAVGGTVEPTTDTNSGGPRGVALNDAGPGETVAVRMFGEEVERG